MGPGSSPLPVPGSGLRHSGTFATILLFGALLLPACASVKPSCGGLPDFPQFSDDNQRPDKPIGGSVGVEFTDRHGRPHQVRVFGAMTPPNSVGPSGVRLREETTFFLGIWWRFDF